MGSVRRTLCTGLLAVVASAPAAHAVDGGAGISLTPASPAPGTDVTLRVNGCSGASGTAASAAFVADARLTGTGGTLTGDTRIRTALRPGSYDVRVSCAGAVVGGRIAVLREAPAAGPSASSYAPPSASASPVAPVDAGGGGTAGLPSVGTRTVAGPVLAGVAAVAVGLLGARRGRGAR